MRRRIVPVNRLAQSPAAAEQEQHKAQQQHAFQRQRPPGAQHSGQQAGQQAAQGVKAKARRGEKRHHPAAQPVGGGGLQQHIDADIAHRNAKAQRRHRRQRQRQPGGEPKHQQRQRAERRAQDDAAHQAGHGLAGGQIQRGHKRPAARRAPQPAQRARIAGKHIAGKHRQQHGVGRGGEVERNQGENQQPHQPGVPGVADPFTKHIAHRALRLGRRRHADAGHGDDQRQKSQRVQRKARRFGQGRQQRAGNRRADKAAAIEQHGVQRQRIGQIFTPANKTANQRLPQWRVKAIEHAQQARHRHQQPRADPAQPGQRRQRQRLHGEQGLHPQQRAALVVLVHPRPGKRPHQQLRNQRGKRSHPQQGRRAGEPIHQPGHRHLLNPRTEDGHRLTSEITAKMRMAQRADGRGPGAGCGSGHGGNRAVVSKALA